MCIVYVCHTTPLQYFEGVSLPRGRYTVRGVTHVEEGFFVDSDAVTVTYVGEVGMDR
jgi:hypothetical protein